MGGRYAPTAFNLRAPILDAIIDTATGIPSVLEQQWRTNLNLVLQSISGIQVSASGGDITASLQQSIGQAIRQGGGVVALPAGTFTMGAVSIPVNSPPVWIIGQGPATIVKRSAPLPVGLGMFNIYSPFVTMSDFIIDGGVTAPVGLQYGVGFMTPINPNDPMAPSLTKNTSIWVHGNGNTTNLSFQRLQFQHAGGYSILLDATTGDISDVDIINCWLVNNRPTLFGTNPGQLIYGSWNGGIFAKGDGRAASGAESGVVSGLLVESCRLARGTGNQLWSHNYGFARFHSNFRYADNSFLDCGLDGILVDCVSGGSVEGNVMRRIGYTTLTDDDRSVPRWLVGLNATGLDSGVVKAVNYSSNSFTSVNGGMVDLDSHMMGSIIGNICRIPFADEPEYTEDSIAITGPTNSGNGSYGLNLGVNSPVAEGGSYLDMIGNTLLNLPAGAIRLYSARFCNVQGNLIQVPATATLTPVLMGPQGAEPYHRCFSNRVSGNHFNDERAGALPVIAEDDGQSGGHPMTAGDINYVFNNLVMGNAAAVEFSKAAGSGSTVYSRQIWFP